MKNTDTPSIERLRAALTFYRDEWQKAEHPFGMAGPAMTPTHRLLCDYGAHARAALTPSAGEGMERTSFQERVNAWLIACFGEEIARDKIERNHRFLEEALELVQAAGCTASEAHQLVDYTFGRPVGEIGQEIGGVMNTLAALCLAHGYDMAAEGDREMERVWTKVDAIREKQRNKPKHSPLPQSPPLEQPDIEGRARELRQLARKLGREYGVGVMDDVLVALKGAADDLESLSLSTSEIGREARELAAYLPRVAEEAEEAGWMQWGADMRDAARLLAALSLPTTEIRREAWQPIETAPKDGIPRLLYWPRIPEKALPEHISVREDNGGPFRHPTHWQPLVAPLASPPSPPSRPSFDKWDYARAVLKDSEGCGR